MSTSDRRVIVAVATPLEPELVARIEAVDDRLEVRFEPDLLPPTRFPGDHRGVDGFWRTAEQEARWRRMMVGAEILFGLPGNCPQALAELVRENTDLRWVQATGCGPGECTPRA